MKLSLYLLCMMIAINVFSQQSFTVKSPDNNINLTLSVKNNRVYYDVSFGNKKVIESSLMALVVNGVLTENVSSLSLASQTIINKTSASRGVHSVSVNHCNDVIINVLKNNTTAFRINAKVFDDGVAFRYIIPATSTHTVNADSTTFTLPAGSTVWYQGDLTNYEGGFVKRTAENITKGLSAGPPATIILANNAGYMAITEAGVLDFPGMSLRGSGQRTFRASLKQAATVTGNIETPWRVIEIGKTLNTLVNCDIIQNVSPELDKTLLPDGYNTSWIAPGKSTWSWLTENHGGSGGVTPAIMRRYSKIAGLLGFAYNLVDDGWKNWTDGNKDSFGVLADLVDSSAKYGVKIWVWKAYGEVTDSVSRVQFFAKCKEAGVVGLKIDFFPGEQQATLAWYQAALRDAAKFHLMLDFHGTNKPTGQSFTYPNEMTREAIRGLEYGKQSWAYLNTIYPFTRFLAGHADYTPFSLNQSIIGGTTLTHQLATLVTFTSPFMCLGVNPDSLIINPIKDIVRDMPTTWDETVVLPQSKIGEISAFARRKGDNWYVAILNGETNRILNLNLSFLPKGKYKITLVQDDKTSPAKAKISDTVVTQQSKLALPLQAGGGLVAIYTPLKADAKKAGNRVMVKTSKQFIVYPNPSKDVLYIQAEGSVKVSVTNTEGKVMLVKNINGNSSINISQLSSGTYYVQNQATKEVKKIEVLR